MQELTDGEGADAVIDFVGENGTTDDAVAMVRNGGSYYVVGYGDDVRIPTIDIVTREINVVGNLVGTYNDLDELMTVTAQGRAAPHADLPPGRGKRRHRRSPAWAHSQAWHPRSRGGLMRLFFATDIHGSEASWHKFLNSASSTTATCFGGDMTGKGPIPIVCNGQGRCHAFLQHQRHKLEGRRKWVATATDPRSGLLPDPADGRTSWGSARGPRTHSMRWR